MKTVLALLALTLLITPALAECLDDGKCTKEEYTQGGCLDCKCSSTEKSYCVDDGICTEIEQNEGCCDCTPDQSTLTGLSVLMWGTGAVVIVVAIAILALIGRRFARSSQTRRNSRL